MDGNDGGDNGAEYRCLITDANGDMGSTRIATIKLDILDWEMEYNTSGIRTKRVIEFSRVLESGYEIIDRVELTEWQLPGGRQVGDPY